ncbi:MAG: acetate uptake transporter [Solirubrobacteraceae bacterium]|jgi:succinate-acetate transporter protein
MEGSGGSKAHLAPLGLAALAVTTFVFSMVQSNLVGGGADVAVELALLFGGLVLLLAGMWEYRAGNTYGAVAYSSLAAFWAVWSFLGSAQLSGALAGNTSGLALLFWVWAAFTAILAIAGLRVSGAALAFFGLLTVSLVLIAIGMTGSGSTDLVHIGGYVGIAAAVAAWYAVAAGIINHTWGKDVLPIIPLQK